MYSAISNLGLAASVPELRSPVQDIEIHNNFGSITKASLLPKKALKIPPSKAPPVSVVSQARDVFYGFYVSGACWDFLRHYYYPSDSPNHLTLAIEAVNLVYLWHQVYSESALAAARQKYVLALQMTNKALKSPEEARKETTLLASLLLDLFEKITNSIPRDNKSWTSHVNGALALVKNCGLEHYQNQSELVVLARLSHRYIVNSMATGSVVPDEVVSI